MSGDCVDQDCVDQDCVDQDYIDQDSAQDSVDQDCIDQDSAQDSVDQDCIDQDCIDQDSAQDSVDQDCVDQDYIDQDSVAKDSAQDSVAKESAPKVLDLRGTPCPINFIRTKLQLAQMPLGALLEVWLDPGEPIEQVPDSLVMEGYEIEALEQTAGFYTLRVRQNRLIDREGSCSDG